MNTPEPTPELGNLWTTAAEVWLAENGVSDRLIDTYADRLAQQLQETAAEFLASLPDLEREAEDAAEDAAWQSKLDESRGK